MTTTSPALRAAAGAGATVVPTGGAAAIMGHNGAGKTTLLRAAVGLLPVRQGHVLMDGEDVTRMRPNARVRRGLGYVPQGQLCFPQMTTLENLQLVSTVRSEIDEVLDLLGEAVAHELLQEAGALGGFRFSHILIRETLYEDLTSLLEGARHQRG